MSPACLTCAFALLCVFIMLTPSIRPGVVWGIQSDFTLFALIFAGDNQDVIILFDFHRLSLQYLWCQRRILVNNLSLNSLAPDQKYEFLWDCSSQWESPLHCHQANISTIRRRWGLVVRMTTARTTSPAFTERGDCFLNSSHNNITTWAYLRPLPPRIFTHITCRAPVLSATFNLVYLSITSSYPKFILSSLRPAQI